MHTFCNLAITSAMLNKENVIFHSKLCSFFGIQTAIDQYNELLIPQHRQTIAQVNCIFIIQLENKLVLFAFYYLVSLLLHMFMFINTKSPWSSD